MPRFHPPSQVQLQVLVATVKIFLKMPEGNDGLLQHVLKMCAEESDNPDLRDRAYLYWRLLSNEGMIDTLGVCGDGACACECHTW